MAAELRTLVDFVAARNPESIAVLAPKRSALSYRGLQACLSDIESALVGAGLGPASRVATVLPNGPEAAVASLSIAASACCLPLNPAYGADELRFYLDDAGADALVLAEHESGPAREVAESMGLAVLELCARADDPAGRFGLTVRSQGRRLNRDGPTRMSAALVLHTSGTTARPKIVPLTQANLAASAQSIARHLRLGPTDRGLNVMPLFHIHGLVGSLFASIAAGASVVCTPGFDEAEFFDWVAEFAPTWYTAVPTIHQAVVAHAADYRSVAPEHRFRFVRSSSASLPPAVFSALESALDAPVIEAYGMTEAAHQMTSNPLPPAPRRPGSVGVSAGAEIMILDDEWRAVPAGTTGEIAIRGDGVAAGYEANPQANAASFRDGWFRTGDLGWIDEEGYLVVAGRIKEIVNRGGEKISPREIDEALLEYPGVAQAVAFGVPHPTLGEDLMAAIVLAAGADVSERALREYLFERLAGFKIPSGLIFVDAIPKGPTGKIQRTSLHKTLTAYLKQGSDEPADPFEQAIADAFAEVLAITNVGRDDNFFALGGDSLSGARVIARLCTGLGVDIQVSDLFRRPTVAALAETVRSLTDVDAHLMAEIDAMSDEEVQALLARYESEAPDADNDPSAGEVSPIEAFEAGR